jgi:hypothetical protein
MYMNSSLIFDAHDVEREVNLNKATRLTTFSQKVRQFFPRLVVRWLMSYVARMLRSTLIRLKGFKEISKTISKENAAEAALHFRETTDNMIVLEELVIQIQPYLNRDLGLKELINENLKTLYTINGNLDDILYADEQLIADSQLAEAIRETGLRNVEKAMLKK